jgi:hypothetical protein
MSMRPTRTAILLLAAALLLVVVPGVADARTKAKPHLSWVRCYGKSCAGKRVVAPGGYVKLAGHRLGPGMRVIFPAKTKTKKRTVKSQVIGSTRLLARVPLNAKSGRLYVTAKHGVRTNTVGPMTVRKKKKPAASPPAVAGGAPSGTAFDGDGMWIWYLSKAEGGNLSAIAQKAHQHGIETVYVKSGDGASYWTQFTPQMVQALHAAGLRVCAWQYVYGKSPSPEASVAARAVQSGADCFVIDAEKEYEGRYSQARTYMSALRAKVGASYPIGMSSFPYVDYHPGLPYSEFFAPGAAQFNLPQVYWREIGDSVDTALDHTYRYNRPYGAAIAAVGQSYNSPPASQITRFRQLAAAEGSSGLSWWEWSSTTSGGFNAIGQQVGPFPGPAPSRDFAPLAIKAKGDLVVWAQEHLQAAGANITADGRYGSATASAVRSFQASKGLTQSGEVDTATWKALLAYAPRRSSKVGRAKAAASVTPKTADLPARRYEIKRRDGR